MDCYNDYAGTERVMGRERPGMGAGYVIKCNNPFCKFERHLFAGIQAFFEETGTTGVRDTTVYELCRRENLVGRDGDFLAGWAKDPYDEAVTSGALMNLSEQEKYDNMFPGFPLSMCREFVKTLEG